MKKIIFLLAIICFLAGCARKTATETIIDGHIEHINNTLGYSLNNFEQTSDVKFLENELEHCKLALVDVKQSYYGELGTCKAKTDYWRLATFGLFVALLGAIFVIIKRIF